MIMNINGKETLSAIPSALEEAIASNGLSKDVLGVGLVVTSGPNMQTKVYFCK